jgi:hypothetical protein
MATIDFVNRRKPTDQQPFAAGNIATNPAAPATVPTTTEVNPVAASQQQFAAQNITTNPATSAQPGTNEPSQPVAGENTSGDTDAPKESNYTWNQDFYKQYMTPEMSPDEEERCKRGAESANAIGQLGNALAGLSNLVFTGKAPSQTLPTVPPPELDKFEQKVQGRRQQYINGATAARRADLNEYLRDQQEYLRNKGLQQQADATNKRIDYYYHKQMQDAADKAAQRKQTAEEKQADRDNAMKIARLREAGANARAENANRVRKSIIEYRSSGGSGKNNKIVSFHTPKGDMDVDFAKINDATLRQYYNSLPDTIKNTYDRKLKSSRSNSSEITQAMQEALGEAAYDDPNIAERLYQSGVATYHNSAPKAPYLKGNGAKAPYLK